MMTRTTDSLPLKGAAGNVYNSLQGEERGEAPRSCRTITAEDGMYRADEEVDLSVPDDDFVRDSII